MIVYADILFLVNLSMDYLTLYLTAILTHGKTTVFRMICASAVGALAGTAATLYSLKSLPYFIVLCVLSLALTLIAFGWKNGVRNLFLQSAAICGCGALLSGVMSALMSMGDPVFFSENKSSSYLPVYVLTVSVSVFLVRVLQRKNDCRNGEVEFAFLGEHIRFSALCDSGNLLKDPLGGYAVIVVSGKIVGEKISSHLAHAMRGETDDIRLRVIPQKTVNGHGLLYGFVPDSVKVNGVEKKAVIALDPCGERDGYGGYSGIVPLGLCK